MARRPSNIMKVLENIEASKDTLARKSISLPKSEAFHKEPIIDKDYFEDDPDDQNDDQNSNIDFIVNFEESNMNQLVHHDRDSGNFANIWSQLLFVTHAYNFITAWYFLGLEGFPSGVWLSFEILAEIILASDILIMVCLKNRMPN